MEYAPETVRGTAARRSSSTHVQMQPGEPHVVIAAAGAAAAKELHLSLPVAAAALRPVLQHVGRRAFQPTAVAGLAQLAAADRAAFYQVG